MLYVSPLKALGNDIQKNLEVPLGEILALAGERGLLMPEIRTAVRTGDTLMHERRAMLKQPPHILVTTPESLYILLTAETEPRHSAATSRPSSSMKSTPSPTTSAARIWRSRWSAWIAPREQARGPVRIGLSATQKPIELVAAFPDWEAARPNPVIVDIGHRRKLDLAVEVPASELGPVASNEMWDEIYDRIVALVGEHRSTLVFVNTRRLAERARAP